LGRPRKRERPPEATRARLIEAARGVFAEEGYAGASIQAIAARADITSGTIYRHFESKAELLLAVVDEAVFAIPLFARLTSDEENTDAFFARLVSAYADPELRQVRRLAIEIHAAASRDDDAAALLNRFNQQIRSGLCQRLEQCIRAGALPSDLDIARTASLLLVIVMGLAHLDTLEPDLLGDANWTHFLEAAVGRLLGR
jgi:AcrR family transcriptional regulator